MTLLRSIGVALPPGRIDWFRIFADLEPFGYSLLRVAAEIGIPRTTLVGWKNIPNTEPRYSYAVLLIELWCDLTHKPTTDLPKRNCRESDSRTAQ
jgi:hypothetical protein